MDQYGQLLLGFVFGAVGTAFGAIISVMLTDRARASFEPIGPTVAHVGGAWWFYYEFQPKIGMSKTDTAVLNAGGGVHLRNEKGESRHQAETIWEGDPVAGTASLYVKKGLLAFFVYPEGHMVRFILAALAPHGDLSKRALEMADVVGFDWLECKEWRLEITVSAPEAAAKTVQTTVAQLCKDANGAEQFPGFPQIISDPEEIKDGVLIKGSGLGIYKVEDGKRRLFPNPQSFVRHGFEWEAVFRVDDNVIKSIPIGQPMPIVIL